MTIQLRKNKWYKHQLLTKCPPLVKFLPMSYEYSSKNLWKMLDLYNEVILKPIVGSGGNGIIKLSKTNDKKYIVHILRSKRTIAGKDALIGLIEQLKGNRPFLIQYCIPLAKVKGKLLDFRYIVQRKKGERKWVITGKHGKIGKKGYFVTNLQQGADVSTVKKALLQSKIKNYEKTMSDLNYLSLKASKCLTRKFKSQTIWGYDLGVDVNGRVWMIEANCSPLVGGFRYLKNLKMYRTIRRYQALNRNRT